MEKQLKRCFFCGGEAEVRETDDAGWFGIYHDKSKNPNCPISAYDGMTIGIYVYKSREEAEQAWNKRTITNIPIAEAWSAIPKNVDTTMFWQAQEGDCICGNHVTRDEHDYCNRCGRKLLWERVRSAQGNRTNG